MSEIPRDALLTLAPRRGALRTPHDLLRPRDLDTPIEKVSRMVCVCDHRGIPHRVLMSLPRVKFLEGA